MKQMLVFNAKKWNFQDHGDNNAFWELATLVKEYRDPQGFLLADVEWPNGEVSEGHFVADMRCPTCKGIDRLDTGEWCPDCAKMDFR